MTLPVLDINDTNLGLWRDGEMALSSPGYALLEGATYRFGEAAREQARLHPRQINHRYWSQLDTEPLTPAFGPSRHTADLVHSHLLAIHEAGGRPEQLLLAAPGSLQHDQLALLLGIIEQCPFSVAGLADRAVAAVASYPVGEYNWHVELQFNQALLTGMRHEGGALVRDNMVPIPGSGWLAFQESLARAVAEAFIRQTRFDPRHSARDEQALFDALPGILRKLLTASETNVEFDGRQARVERSSLAEACDSHYQRILRTLAAGDARVFLGSTLFALPALTELLPEAVQCEAAAVSAGVTGHQDQVLADGSGIRFITSLPAHAATGSAKAAPAPTQTPAAEKPPEIEQIEPSRCQIEFSDGELHIQPVSGPAPALNGQPLGGAARLGDGDRLELPDGSSWRLVRESAGDS
ncbi:MAG: hypothetical protein V2I66_10530 [Halieaceae bacterium]|jgi:hypothetical protein|nr:hypothetical protein [Halieaceae bacterium]